VFTSAPAQAAEVEIEYTDSTVQAPEVSNNDVWQFANSLEGYSEQNGYGNTADFLFKIATNDFHGERIKAAMQQARNKKRIEQVGINCPGTNRVDGESDAANFNYIERTGIWSPDPNRAGEVALYNATEIGSYEKYFESQLRSNRDASKRTVDRIAAQIANQLVYFDNANINVSNQFLDFYDRYEMDPAKAAGNEIILSTRTIPNRENSYVIGPYQEILSEFLRIEKLKDVDYDVPISNETRAYLQTANINMRTLTTLLQKIMLFNLSRYFNLTERQIIDIYETPSVSKAMFANINTRFYQV
jgi:hypothetical protein